MLPNKDNIGDWTTTFARNEQLAAGAKFVNNPRCVSGTVPENTALKSSLHEHAPY